MNKKYIGMLEMAVCAILWSIAGVFIKKISVGAIVIAGTRSAFAVLCTFIYMKIMKIKFCINKRVFFGSLCTSATFLLFVSANKLTDAANAIVLQYTQPLFILIFSWIFYREKFVKRDIAVALTTLFGIALFFADNISGEKLFGNFVAIGAGAAIALAFMIYGHVTKEERFSGMLMGHLMTAVVGVGFLIASPVNITVTDWLYMGILGIFQLGVAYIFFCLAVEKISGFACSIIGVIEPLLNPLLVMIFIGEKPGKFAFWGCAVVILAVTAWGMLDAKDDALKKEKSAVN